MGVNDSKKIDQYIVPLVIYLIFFSITIASLVEIDNSRRKKILGDRSFHLLSI